MDIAQDSAAMLVPGDLDKLDKREREAFCELQESLVSHLLQEGNHFQTRFPGLRLDWKFQIEVYQSPQVNPSTVRYSSRVY